MGKDSREWRGHRAKGKLSSRQDLGPKEPEEVGEAEAGEADWVDSDSD